MTAAPPYSLELAEEHIANARGDVDRLSEILTQNNFTAGQVPNTPASGYSQYASSGVPAVVLASGLQESLSGGGQVQLVTNNVTAATGTLASATISAGDPVAGSVYELEAQGGGNVGLTPALMAYGCLVGGSLQGVANGPAASAIVASQAFRWSARVKLVFRTAGVSGTAVVTGEWHGAQTANNIVPGTAADWGITAAFGVSSTINVNTTASFTLGLQVSTGGTVSVDCIAAYLKRVA